MSDIPIQRLLIEKGAEPYGITSNVLRAVGPLTAEKSDPERPKQKPHTLDMDKETLRLLSFPGRFLKPCPGTKTYLCCGYQILNIGTNCPFDCSYCILQAYFNQPSLRVFVNLEDQLEGLTAEIDARPEKIFRVGTGEFTDSLALNPITGLTDRLLPAFSKRKNAVLELKTKYDNVKRLFSSPERQRIIISWSLNSRDIAAREEKRAPGIEKRLQAARKCQEEGFVIGFHFDPLIEYPGWRDGYLKTIELLGKNIDPKGIVWVSMGCFRYLPALKGIIRRRHPETHILDGEFVPGLDGKMRYFKPVRIEMYGYMAGLLSEWHKDLGLYLCMESEEVWRKSLGWSPENSSELSDYLDQRVIQFFG